MGRGMLPEGGARHTAGRGQRRSLINLSQLGKAEGYFVRAALGRQRTVAPPV